MSTTTGLIPLVVVILGLGVAARVLADKLQVPSVLFLILAGVAVGPEGAGLITATSFGDSLSAIVGLSVAIIIFEGSFHLTVEKLRQTPREALRLVTVGALVALVGTAVVVKVALPVSWGVAFLVGSLLVATGPTVITPVLDVVSVRDRVAAALETEGIVNDVTAAILAVVTFEFVVLSNSGIVGAVRSFVARLGIGVLVGVLVAGTLWYLLQHTDLSPENAVQHSRLLVLVGALGAYGVAEELAPEAGIAAVATAGVLLGNADLPYEEEIAAFEATSRSSTRTRRTRGGELLRQIGKPRARVGPQILRRMPSRTRTGPAGRAVSSREDAIGIALPASYSDVDRSMSTAWPS